VAADADEADLADKDKAHMLMQPMRTMWHPDKANEADEANEAEVNEANAKADITNEADVDQCQQGKCQRDRS
jgi:hypothetical protein